MTYDIVTSRQFEEVIGVLGSNESIRYCRVFLEAWRLLERSKGLKCRRSVVRVDVFDGTSRPSAYLMIPEHSPIVLNCRRFLKMVEEESYD